MSKTSHLHFLFGYSLAVLGNAILSPWILKEKQKHGTSCSADKNRRDIYMKQMMAVFVPQQKTLPPLWPLQVLVFSPCLLSNVLPDLEFDWVTFLTASQSPDLLQLGLFCPTAISECCWQYFADSLCLFCFWTQCPLADWVIVGYWLCCSVLTQDVAFY